MDIKEFFQDAVRKQASDIFLIPGMPLAMKINGRIEPVGEEKVFPAEMDNYIREIYAISGNRDMTRIQEQGDDDFSFSIVGLSRFRASVMKQRGSLAAVIRIVRFDLPNPADIHIPETVLNIASMKKGMVLVTGAAGSGKSTTLACVIDRINQTRNAHVITLEDPIEYQIDGISQVAVHPKIGLTFARCLRSILRQDPDLIVVGEIRDRETAEMSVHAALTGHLVFSTLHTNTAVGAVSRLLDLGVDSYLVASALKGIVAQRLLRRLCLQCRTAYAVGENSWERTYFSLKGPLHLFHASSCAHCRGTGYSGRLAVQEVFPFDEACRQAAARGLGEKALLELGRQQQVASLFEDGRAKVLAGETSPEEMLHVLGPLEKK